MTAQNKLMNVLTALNSLTDKDLNELSNDELKLLQESLDEKKANTSFVIRNRNHQHTHFPKGKN